MFKQKVLSLFLVIIALTMASCGMVGDEEEDFGERHNTGYQLNGPLDPDDQFPYFKLTEVFDNRGSLEDAWDSVDGPTFNGYLAATVDDYTDPFIEFSHANSKILGADSGLMTIVLGRDVANILDYLTNGKVNSQITSKDIGQFYTQSGEVYQQGFYSLLDELYKEGENSGKMEMPAIGRKIVQRMLDKKSADDLHNDMEDLVEDVTGTDFNKDFKDLHEVLGKLVVQAEYPLWVDSSTGAPLSKGDIDPENSGHTNTGIGNAVQGLFDQAKWVNLMLKSTNERGYFHDLVNEVTSLFDPSPASSNNIKIKKLLENIEENFTKDGSQYTSTDDAVIYSDTELGNTIREMLPGSLQLMLRSDRLASLIGDKPGSEKKYVLREMTNNLKALQFDPETQNIEKSLMDLMKHDVWGIDRTDTSSGASPTSYLESLLFITQVSSNLGWTDRGEASADEITAGTDARYEHGHGEHTGSLTLNDSLFSMKTHKVQSSLGIYEISLKETDGDYKFRSRKEFDLNDSDKYKFHHDQDYDVLNMLAGPGVGDFGASDGGNPDGVEPAFNGYEAYSPDGRSEKSMSAWTLGWITRACFNGEGPYYYADPEAETVSFDSKNWKRYLRPDGKTYALVSEHGDYLYPAEGNDPTDDETERIDYNQQSQRYNRYKSEWKTDYYLAKYIITGSSDPQEDGYYGVTLEQDDDGNVALVSGSANENISATSLTYKELIPENDSLRACTTPEEALFRNYQWLMTEKKMVIVMPLVIDMNVPDEPKDWGINGDVFSEVIAFQVLESNGMSGLTNLRKFRLNHLWAKKGTNGKSTIPGDYRIEVVSSDIGTGATSARKIYNTTLDCGTATPAVVGHNIPALYRFGFPVDRTSNTRSPGIVDMEVGSKEFKVGDNDKWANRNAVLMPFISLVAAIYNNTPEERTSVKAGLKSFVEGTSPLIKPLVYFQKGTGQHPYKTWKPMVRGGEAPAISSDWDGYTGDDFLRSSADFHDGSYHLASSWDGTAAEKAYYQPAVVKTLLNVLIDSDITAKSDDAGYSNSRMDGVLPMLAETKTITALLKSLLSEANDSDLIYSSLEQINGALKFTKGRMTEINQVDSYKQIAFPYWMFATGVEATRDIYGAYTEFTGVRTEDIVVDRGIDRLLGHKEIDAANDGYGLSAYAAEQRLENWKGFYDTVDMLEDFLHPESPYSIVQNVLNINDALFARERAYQDVEIAGLLYAVGKLITVKNGQYRWITQGENGFDDILKLITERFPEIHNHMKDNDGFSGNNYRSMLVINSDILKENGLAEYMVGALSTEEDFETIFSDVKTFINDPIVTEMDPLWLTLSDLLHDMAAVLEITKDGEDLDEIYQDFGFQQN